MSDKLPFLPKKEAAVCADVRPVLREVFRDLEYFPPVTKEPLERKNNEESNVLDVSSEYKRLYDQELKLQKENAKRLARDTLPNIYRLHSPVELHDESSKTDVTLLHRSDLKPCINQNSNYKETLWVKNILNRSSGDVTVADRKDMPLLKTVPFDANDEVTLQSVSVGEIIPRPGVREATLISVPPAIPKSIICIPSKLDFVNFTVGQLHTVQFLRLVNVSKFEVRLSIRPPSRQELDIQLCSRLVVTSGSEAEMKIHYRPKDVRALTDELLVRVSSGQTLCIPIVCYMEPPILEILVLKPSLYSSVSETTDSAHDLVDMGARLLGDIHRAQLLLRCNEQHASFFLISEDSWTNYTIECLGSQLKKTENYGVTTDSFYISPARWSGGGSVKGLIVCHAVTLGLHIADFKVISSSAITRPLHVLADTMMFTVEHISVQSHDKDYDICSEDDVACEYYVNLGTAFPHRELSAEIRISNNSALNYNYYWSKRLWGVCYCWSVLEKIFDKENDDYLCPGAIETKLKSEKGAENLSSSDIALQAVVVEEQTGHLSPRSTVQVVVRVPDVGAQLGTQRAVIMLILKDIPIESIKEEDHPLIVSSMYKDEEAIPGISPKWSHELCEVVVGQIEVWWNVEPVRFALDPPLLRLYHSRRVKMLDIQLRTTQLYGITSVRANWKIVDNAISPLDLNPEKPDFTTASIPLEKLPNELPRTTVIRLVANGEEWSASTKIEQYCDTRHPSIQPAMTWLGIVPPGAVVTALLLVHNYSYEDIDWCAPCYRWWGERGIAEACEGQPPCKMCLSHACTCSILTPTHGSLKHSHQTKIRYKVHAPDTDGCVATLVQVRRKKLSSRAGVVARAALLTYRVLAPHLVLRVFPCLGDKSGACEACTLDVYSETSPRGSAVLRPHASLALGDRLCCRLSITNITPLPTSVQWESAIEGHDILSLTFFPNEFKLDGHSEANIMVVLNAKQVCSRRLFTRRAKVLHTNTPLYLVVDAAISGVEVIVEFPLGGDENTDSFASIKFTQKDGRTDDSVTQKLRSIEDDFSDFERKKEIQKENICYCPYKMVYIPPEKKPRKPPSDSDEDFPIEIVEEPPPFTRVCRCTICQKPILPENPEPYCLQFKQLPLRTVRTRKVVLRNVSRVDTRWRAATRRWPRRHTRTINKEQWAGDVREPGVVLHCECESGVLRARSETVIQVSAYADCWGLYYDQIIIQMENLDSLILDVWIEAIGLPLEIALRPTDHALPALWMSDSDPERTVRIKNTSRADLIIYAYLAKESEYQQDLLPFRLYVRLYDVPTPTCPCITGENSDSSMNGEASLSSKSSLNYEEMDTDAELLLTADHGAQDDTFYKVEPLECIIRAGECANYKIHLLVAKEIAPHSVLILRPLPVEKAGNCWYRPTPPLQLVQLRQVQRTPRLQASCSELRVKLCALDLPYDDIIRVRKTFRIQNVGDGSMETTAVTEAPWRIGLSNRVCEARCLPNKYGNLTETMKLYLPSRSSTEIVAEVSVKTNDVWPALIDEYSSKSKTTMPLYFYDHDGVLLLTVSLTLDIDYPVLKAEPGIIVFGDVNDGYTRKNYFTVMHTSLKANLDLVTRWTGGDEFRIWPPTLYLEPGSSKRIYIEYTARWLSGDTASGSVSVSVRGAAGSWCVVAVPVTARPQRCATRNELPHKDYTDDKHLMPRDVYEHVIRK